MSKSKVNMPKDLEKKCHMAIHSATATAAAAGAIPLPMADAVPITATQIAMVVGLGKIFGITLSESTAKSIMGVSLTQTAGRALATNLMKALPGVRWVGSAISATVAAALTETLGWMVADDFYRLSIGKEPKNLTERIGELKILFGGLRMHKV